MRITRIVLAISVASLILMELYGLSSVAVSAQAGRFSTNDTIVVAGGELDAFGGHFATVGSIRSVAQSDSAGSRFSALSGVILTLPAPSWSGPSVPAVSPVGLAILATVLLLVMSLAVTRRQGSS